MGKIVSLHEHAQKKMREENRRALRAMVEEVVHPFATDDLREMIHTAIDSMNTEIVLENEPLGVMMLDMDIGWAFLNGKAGYVWSGSGQEEIYGPLQIQFIDRRWNIDFISTGQSHRSQEQPRERDENQYPPFAVLQVAHYTGDLPDNEPFDYRSALFNYADSYLDDGVDPSYPALFFVPASIAALMLVRDMAVVKTRIEHDVIEIVAVKDHVSYSLLFNFPELLRQHVHHHARQDAVPTLTHQG